MNILFISSAQMPDYQCDCLFHGLRTLFGRTVIDVNKISYMYKSFPETDRTNLYGRGFSLYCLLDELDIDRTEIDQKILNKYFDLIIYGSIHRCQDYLSIVLENYPCNKILFIDGEDHQNVIKSLLNRGVYFKRELSHENRYLFPIHFAIPEEKFISNIYDLKKDKFFAPCNPKNKKTYIYKTEETYYRQYQESFFGITIKKAGWDCLRHYEIISQGCAPYFYKLAKSSYLTMHQFPRLEVFRLMQIADDYLKTKSLNLEVYLANLEYLFNYGKKHLTTKALAKYVISCVS
jgi:hypothetical protein